MDINSFVIGYQKGKASAGGGGGSMEGFHMVRFFNDDRTTLLYTVFVPTGVGVIYAGETPMSTTGNAIFRGFEPSAVNVTADLDCYAVYDAVGTLDESSWEIIAELSANGEAQNYFAVGDTKMIHVEGTVGTLAVNGDYGVYIIGFDHNEELEGKGIHFGTFKNSDGKDLFLDDSKFGASHTDGKKYFSMNHTTDKNYGGWRACDLRFDILGSTDKQPNGYGSSSPSTTRYGYDASETCATNPVAGTLMAALPADLRAVMKPMTKYTDNTGNAQDIAGNVTQSVDYLPLLAEFEVCGVRSHANSAEQTEQKQYAYYAAGNSSVKYRHSNIRTAGAWYFRSVGVSSGTFFSFMNQYNTSNTYPSNYSRGVAPIFKV